ncbi:MAG: M48 family metallopeptidase, partial [Sulfuritalea sp.]|nr:M48 family metallopeptidase [Sulfuritalea sp.]
MTLVFTSVFLAALLLTTLLRLWLARRHVRHVAAHREAVPEAFRETISMAAHQRAADYTVAKVRLAMVEVVVGALFVLALTLGGVLQTLHEAWAALGLDGLAHGIAFIAGLVVLSSIVDLPFSLYRTFTIEAHFGFNKMTLRLFIVDLAKGALLGALIGLPVLLAVLWLMEGMGSLWWLYVWLFWLGFNLLALLIYPTVIAPLFNKFTPLADTSLRERIEALMARCGFRASGLFVMDGSKRSAHGNAYFTGFGQAKRIVFFDTLLEKLAPEEIEAVLAHELGHYRLRHVWKRIGVLA